MTFTPTPFATPVIAPNTVSAYRSASYISASEYRFAPTAVGTQGLVPKSTSEQGDSLGSLAQVISRASAWMDQHCFHRGDGSFAAGVTTEQMVATVKPSGVVVLICNFKPIRQVIGVGVGPSFSQLTNLNQNVAGDILIGDKTITLPGYWNAGLTFPVFASFPSIGGGLLCVYSYVAGWPHTTLSVSASAGATSITVNPSTPGGTALYGAYGGSQLWIKDGPNTEAVVLASSPSGLTLSLASPLLYPHNVPEGPDSIIVSALPWGLEQACISLTNVILKQRGMRAVLPGPVGSPSPQDRQALARAGALADFEIACKLLHPFKVSYLH